MRRAWTAILFLTLSLMAALTTFSNPPSWISAQAILPLQAAADAPGLDVVILRSYTEHPEDPDVLTAMTTATVAVGQYLGERTQYQAESEIHTLAVINFNSSVNVVLQPTPMPYRNGDGELDREEFATRVNYPTPNSNRYGDYLSAFERAWELFSTTPVNSQRTRVLIVMADDPYAVDANTTPSGLEPVRAQVDQIGRLFDGVLSGVQLMMFGFGSAQRWIDFDDFWNTPLAASAGEMTQVNVVSPNDVGPRVLDAVRSFLDPVGTVMRTGEFEVDAYQRDFSVFHVRQAANDSVTLEYRGTDTGYQPDIEIQNGDILQTLVVHNPAPGTWFLRARGDVEFTQRIGAFVQEVRLDNAVISDALVDQMVNIVWKPVGAENQTIMYGDFDYRLTVEAQIRLGQKRFTVPLEYQVNGADEGAYSGTFYGAEAGTYTIETIALLNEMRLPQANALTLSLAPIELVVDTSRVSAQQFTDWRFSTHFESHRQRLTSSFAVLPQLEATLSRENQISYPLAINDFDSITGDFTSTPIDLFWSGTSSLEVLAYIEAYNGQRIRLPTRARNGITAVNIASDAGIVTVSNTTPALLDLIDMRYRPRQISSATFGTRYNETVIAHVEENVTGGTRWNIPMTLTQVDGESMYVAQFYATRAVSHTVSIHASIVSPLDQGTVPIVEQTFASDVVPHSLIVRLDTDLNATQLVPFDLRYTLISNGNVVYSPFSSGVTIVPTVRFIREDDETIAVPMMPNGSEGFTGSHTFMRAGEYTLEGIFNVIQSPYTQGGNPQFVSLPLDVGSSTLMVVPAELVVNTTPARQFSRWSFTAHFEAAESDDIVTFEPATRPQLDAAIRVNGETIPVTIAAFDETFSRYTSDEVDIYFMGGFDLTVSATTIDELNETVTLQTKAEDARTTVDIIADPGVVLLSSRSPRLLDLVTISYYPANIDPLSLTQNYNTAISALITPQDDPENAWTIPLALRPTGTDGRILFEGSFFFTKATAHTVEITGSSPFLGDNAPGEIIRVAGGTIEPRPILVRLDTSTTISQFEEWRPQFTILDGVVPLSEPFTSNLAFAPVLVIEQDGNFVANIPLTQGDILADYTGSYTFIRAGDYQLQISFLVQQQGDALLNEERTVSLPFTNMIERLIVEPTASNLSIFSSDTPTQNIDSTLMLRELLFTLTFPSIGADRLVEQYGATTTLTLSHPDFPTPQRLEMQYVPESNRFEARYLPAAASSYTVQAEIRSSANLGSRPILTSEQIGTRSLLVRPLTIAFEPLNRAEFRQGEPISGHLFLFDSGTVYTDLEAAFAPDVTVRVLDAGDNIVFSQLVPYQEVAGNYAFTLPAFDTLGNYRVEFDAQVADSSGTTYPLLTSDLTEMSFSIVESQILLVSALGASEQYSTGVIPLSERLPIIVDVILEAIPRSDLDAGNLAGDLRVRVEPSVAFSTAPDQWFTLTVSQGDEVLDAASYEVSQPEQLRDGVTRFRITRLPDAANYIINVSLANEPNNSAVNFPYAVVNARRSTAFPIIYQTNPSLWMVAGGAITLALVMAGVGLRVRDVNQRRYPANSGVVFLADKQGRVFWAKDLRQVTRNGVSIAGAEHWGRALINQIVIKSSKRLAENKSISVKVRIAGAGVPFEKVFRIDHEGQETVALDNRFLIGWSHTPIATHTHIAELHALQSLEVEP